MKYVVLFLLLWPLPIFSKTKIVLDEIIQMATTSPLILRTENTIMSWIPTKKELQFRVLKTDGNDLLVLKKSFTLDDLKKLLGTMKTKIMFSNKAAIITEQPIHLKKKKHGILEIQLGIKTIFNKTKKPVILKHSINIGTLNTLHFWDGNKSNTKEEQLYIYDLFRPEFSNWYDPEIQKAKAKSIIKEIRFMGIPEIIGFQEIESARGKSELFKKGTAFRKELELLGYQYFLLGTQEKDNPVAITTAFISRYPMTNGTIPFNVNDKTFRKFSSKEKNIAHYTTRDIQVATLKIGQSETFIYNNHWRSQGCHNLKSCHLSEQIRIANAKTLKREIKKTTKKNPLADIIILGDMNVKYSHELLRVLGSTGNEMAIQKGADGRFYNLWHELPPTKRWEVSHQGRHGTLEQMLIASSLYDNVGLQYQDNSFRVTGHTGEAKKAMINADGNPFRWQSIRLRLNQIPKSLSNPIKKILKNRGCSEDDMKSKRRCRVCYTKFTGAGFTDHLPLVATFNYVGNKSNKSNETKIIKQTSINPSSTTDVQNEVTINTEVIECKNRFVDIEKINLKQNDYFGQCAKLNPAKAYQLETMGIYDSCYIVINGKKLGITMARSFDPRPIKNGKPVPGNSKKMHPESNMCFSRKVLQGKGGKIKKAFGRMGYSNGIPSLIIANRKDVELTNLPANKKSACRRQKDHRRQD